MLTNKIPPFLNISLLKKEIASHEKPKGKNPKTKTLLKILSIFSFAFSSSALFSLLKSFPVLIKFFACFLVSFLINASLIFLSNFSISIKSFLSFLIFYHRKLKKSIKCSLKIDFLIKNGNIIKRKRKKRRAIRPFLLL